MTCWRGCGGVFWRRQWFVWVETLGSQVCLIFDIFYEMGEICQKPRTQKQYIVRKRKTNRSFGRIFICLIARRSCVVSSTCVPSLTDDGSAVTHFGRKVANELYYFILQPSQSFRDFMATMALSLKLTNFFHWVTNDVSTEHSCRCNNFNALV